jgi:uncharacterized RDD family membrane protein YckC
METLHLAKWETRFWAWLIDFVLILCAVSVLKFALAPFAHVPYPWEFREWWFFDPGLQSVFFLLYWTILEGYSGQSVGKMALNIRITDRSGGKIGYGAAFIESFGKAFLLPIDCLIGWLAMPKTNLRLFNRLSGTIVIISEYREPEGVQYVKEPE